LLSDTFEAIEDVVSMENLSNAQLKQIIQKILVKNDGNCDIYLSLFGGIGLDNILSINNNCTYGVPISCRCDYVIEYGK